MKKYLLFGALVLSIGAVSTQIVFADNATPAFGWLDSLASQFGTLVVMTIPVLIALAFLVFVWGLVVFISASGSDSAKEEGKRKMIWGIIAIFVLVSIWGILTILRELSGTKDNTKFIPTPWI